ncbi:MAG TPA: 50S ribosomal protein L24e [Thermoplasmata archaeon]|nr:50S ribosomal protein L24e [Thermoplasmata archaeon]
MVVKRQCSFCSQEIEPGTGSMFVKRDGTVFHFCSGSCRKQQLHLGRVGHRFKWTRAHALKKAADRSSAAARAQAPAAPPHRARGRTRGAGPPPASPAPAVPADTPSAAAPPPAEAAPAPEPPAAKAAKPRARPRKKAETPATDA